VPPPGLWRSREKGIRVPPPQPAGPRPPPHWPLAATRPTSATDLGAIMPVGHDETELCEHATRTTGSAYSNQHTCTLQDLRARSDARSRSRLTVVDTSSRELVLTYVLASRVPTA